MEDKFEREVLDRLIVIETKMDMLAKTTGRVEEAYNVSMKNEEDIKEMKGKMQWLWKTAIGAVITGAIGILITVLKVNIGL